LILTIEKFYPNWRDLKIHESSPAKRGASMKLKNECKSYLATQYFPYQTPGGTVNGFRNEDLERQTFPDESFDLVITQDVMEHVYEPVAAFAEIARTLKKGGAHIFTTPLVNKFKKTEVWAKKGDDGKPIFLNTPEYHGNPIDPKGSPVTMHWGFDIVEFIKDCSGLETTIEYIDDLNYGIRAEFIEVLVSVKK
jgi:SAM-dependent methyltransferase